MITEFKLTARLQRPVQNDTDIAKRRDRESRPSIAPRNRPEKITTVPRSVCILFKSTPAIRSEIKLTTHSKKLFRLSRLLQ